MSEPSFHEIATDRAIEHNDQDAFDRQKFALHLAQGIAQRRGRSSFVVALQGAWGCGKSSIKNMALEHLDKMEGAPYVVEFEPWQLRDADSLFATFFGEIALALQNDDDTDEGKKTQARKEKLMGYSKSLAFGGSVVKSLGILAGMTGVPLAKLIELGGEKMGDAADMTAKGADAIGIPKEQSLRDQKRELNALLADLERPILVIIDDIDRLEIAEMMLLFQLVKANADFPNFTYLLLLQRDRVQDALTKHMGDYGRDYLDKIIQLPIDVPPANSMQRFALLQKGIEGMLEIWELPFSDDQRKDLNLLWTNGLSEFLAQPRDIVRVLNAVEFSLSILKTEAGLEVNLSDGVALEAVRVLEAATYARLPSIKRFLTEERPAKRSENLGALAREYEAIIGTANSDAGDDEQPGQAEMEAGLKELSPLRSQAARRVLTFVFPKAAWALGTQGQPQTNVSKKRPLGRVRAQDKFDRYFDLAIPVDQVSQAELKRFLDALAASDVTALDQQMEGFVHRELHKTFFWELYDELLDIPRDQLATLLWTQLDFWDTHSYYPGLERLFTVALIPIREPQQKGELLREVFERSRAYGIPSLWLLRQGDLLQKSDRPDERYWTDEAHFLAMREVILTRIARHIDTPEFWTVPRPLNAIELWFSVQPKQTRAWVAGQIATDAQLPLFLERFCDHETFDEADPSGRQVTFAWPIFLWLDDVAALKTRVEALDTSNFGVLISVAQQEFSRYAEGWLKHQAENQAIEQSPAPIGNAESQQSDASISD